MLEEMIFADAVRVSHGWVLIQVFHWLLLKSISYMSDTGPLQIIYGHRAWDGGDLGFRTQLSPDRWAGRVYLWTVKGPKRFPDVLTS